jgi:histidinol-phosphate aminotransferase
MEPNTFVKNLKEYKTSSHRAWDIQDGEVLKLDWNESDLELPNTVRDSVVDFIHTGKTCWYPDIHNKRLLSALSSYVGVPPEYIQYFEGSDCGLDYVVRTFLAAQDEVLMPAPCYDNFRVYVEAVGAVAKQIYPDDIFASDLAQLQAHITERTKMVYIINPSNPTGVLYSVRDIENLVAQFPNIIFVIDEAYAEFAGTTAVPLVNTYSNLIVARSMSKAFGLASFRLGYIIAAPSTIQYVNKIRNGKNVPMVTQIAAIAALSNTTYMEEYVVTVRQTMDYVVSLLREMNVSVRETKANFILISVPEIESFCKALEARNVFIRNLSHLPRMDGYARITIGRRDTMEKFLKILREQIQHDVTHQ